MSTNFDSQPYMAAVGMLIPEGRFEDALLCYASLLLVEPALYPSLWQRGLALFYAGRFAEGRAQFEAGCDHNSADVEEIVWRFMCDARDRGLAKAREAIQSETVLADARAPMKAILAYFQGLRLCTAKPLLRLSDWLAGWLAG